MQRAPTTYMCIELFQLRNKVAIVTGASRGLGKSMAMALAEVGANLVLVGRDKERLEGAAREIADFGVKTLPVIADVTRAEEVEAVVSRTLEEFGKIDVLVNNVGTYLGKPIVESTPEDWHNLINTNLTSTYLCSRAVGRYMVERQRGKVINMAAALGDLGANNASAYCTSKGGVIPPTRALAVERARYHINVTA
ncbi:MAG TPA: SDR family NAD(P)-dependent oxidoreductase, partial [Candidatus Tripitaka californicus]|uniref:SDR family NAD(P)-dependent oxidoreductase n=1 Tax=Candidatus Tripitaka californicus TaxID=3367616 RepID=UPI0040283597